MTAPRVRFCPAPSGWLHVGGARTALYNWLHARATGGVFVFRVEDTDATRATEESMRGMLDALRWLGLDWDEGPEAGGEHGPYRQSERGPLYAAVVDLLLRVSHAYDAYETPQELADMREAAQREGRPPGYDGAQRTLDDEQRDAFRAEGRNPVIRLRTPDVGAVVVPDLVLGDVEFRWSDISDFILLRADGSPTYQLANAVDDLAMGINLIARGQDLLPATPRQLYLYDALLDEVTAGVPLIDAALREAGFPGRPADAERPAFAHLPLLVGADRKPLSKRHGSVAVDEFRRQGVLPEVLLNFLALCGWSYDATTERMTVDELVDRFTFARVGRNPAFFDVDKLRALNGARIKELDDAELVERLQPYFADALMVLNPPTPAERHLLFGLAPLLRERIQLLGEAVDLAGFAFAEQLAYDPAAVVKHLKPPADQVLERAEAALRDLAEWTSEAIQAALDGVAAALEIGRGKAFQPVRVAVAGSAVSPPLPETLALLDRALVLDRVAHARTLVSAG